MSAPKPDPIPLVDKTMGTPKVEPADLLGYAVARLRYKQAMDQAGRQVALWVFLTGGAALGAWLGWLGVLILCGFAVLAFIAGVVRLYQLDEGRSVEDWNRRHRRG